MTEILTKRAELLDACAKFACPLPECKETQTWGNPTFVAGKKQFAVLDRYHDRWCIAFVTSGDRAAGPSKAGGVLPCAYGAKYGWVCRDAEGRIAWKEMQKLLVESYRKVALKRMLDAMEKSEVVRV